MDSFWREKTVVITGASSGIGQALALETGLLGARVGLLARNESRLRTLCQDLGERGVTAAWAAADVAAAGDVHASIASLETSLGPCDVLIANAGIYRKTDVTDFRGQAINQVIQTNVCGVVNSIDAVLPAMVQRQSGHLVAISSIASIVGLPCGAAYCASKAAVYRLMESLRVDLRAHKVSVSTICPGYIDTPLLTDEERRTRRDILPVDVAAQRICRAIARRRAEDWFPWITSRLAWSARLLPPRLFDWAMAMQPPMEENSG